MISGISGHVMILISCTSNPYSALPYPTLPTQYAVSSASLLGILAAIRPSPYPPPPCVALHCSHLPVMTLLISLPISSTFFPSHPLPSLFLFPFSFLFSLPSLRFPFHLISYLFFPVSSLLRACRRVGSPEKVRPLFLAVKRRTGARLPFSPRYVETTRS